ncbi:MAG TPA: glycosyltransferase [Arcobacter sp.]|nr:glycosyltransferase [Arcobacter sp.]
MKFFIIGDMFTGLKPWLLEDKEPKGMPGAYNFYQMLGRSNQHTFQAIIINKEKNKIINFPNGSTIELKKMSISNQYIFRICALPYSFILGRRYLKENSFNVIYSMANYSMVSTLLGNLYNIFTVSRMFGAFSPKYLKEKKYFPIYTRNLLEYLATKYAGKLFISTQDGTQHNLLVDYAKPNSEFYMMFNGIDEGFRDRLLDISPISKVASDKKIKISYIARLSWWKRQDIALNVVDILVKKYNLDIELLVFGNGPDLENLKQIVEEKEISNNVKFLGSLAREEYIKVLHDIDISLYMYDFSNLGNALWETMYAGKLIATKDAGDTGKYLQDGVNALVVDENDNGEEIAKKIYECLDRDVSSIVRKSRETIGKLVTTWDDRIQKELYMIEDRVEKFKGNTND